jgi:hypothetical protein
MIVAIFWATAPCGLYVNRCFKGMYRLSLEGRISAEQETSLQQVASSTSQKMAAFRRKIIPLPELLDIETSLKNYYSHDSSPLRQKSFNYN